MKVTITYDNRSLINGLDPDWGFSCVLENQGSKVLFDTGANATILTNNLRVLEFDSFSDVLISHNHWDHTDGLPVVAQGANCYIVDSSMKTLGEEIRSLGGIPISCKERREIAPSIWTTGEMGVDIGEQGAVFVGEDSLVLITGCAHPGIVHMVEAVGSMFGQIPTAVIGGFHLYENNRDQVENLVTQLRVQGVQTIAPCHCSGDEQIEWIKQCWDATFEEVTLGWCYTTE